MKITLVVAILAVLFSRYTFAEEILELAAPEDISISIKQVAPLVMGGYAVEVHIAGLEGSIESCTHRYLSGATYEKGLLEKKLTDLRLAGKMVLVQPIVNGQACLDSLRITNLDVNKVLK